MQMPHRAFVAVDDRGGVGQQFTEIIAVEHEMRASKHYGVDGRQIVVAEIMVQGAHYGVMVVQLAMLDDVHQAGAGFGENRVVRLEPVHQLGEFALAQGERRGCDDNALAVPVAAVAGDFERRFHADDRDVVGVAQCVGCCRCGGVAGDDHGLHALFYELFHDGEAEIAHLLRGFGPIWRIRGITEIQHLFVRHIVCDLPGHRNAAEAGIEYADRCR